MGRNSEHIFFKVYVDIASSGLLKKIPNSSMKTLIAICTHMKSDGEPQ